MNRRVYNITKAALTGLVMLLPATQVLSADDLPSPFLADLTTLDADFQPGNGNWRVGGAWRPYEDATVKFGYSNLEMQPFNLLSQPQELGDHLDLGAGYKMGKTKVGQFSFFGQISYLVRYKEENVYLTEPPSDLQAELGMGWKKGAFSGEFKGQFSGDSELVVDQFNSDQVIYDLQLSWKTPWLGELSLGAKNLLDNQSAPLPTGFTALNKAEQELGGRIPYVKYTLDL